MTHISVPLPDAYGPAATAAAGGADQVPTWAAAVLRRELMTKAFTAAAAYDRDHDDPDGEAARLAGAA
jgi:hypothetical protein